MIFYFFWNTNQHSHNLHHIVKLVIKSIWLVYFFYLVLFSYLQIKNSRLTLNLINNQLNIIIMPENNISKLSKIDRNILRILQEDARISYAELARQVGLTTTPCIERVRKLEKLGVINSYRAILNPEYLDAGLVVFVQIRLSRTSQDNFEAFRHAAIQLDEVQECYLVSGNFDYLIKARVAGMPSYREFLGETLLTLPGVDASTSYVVMEQVKETLAIPVPYR
jgi:Lrp/AsnC family leucine-responsive transcriptional regulator